MPQPYIDSYAEPNAEVYTQVNAKAYTKAYAKKHVEQDPRPNIEPYDQTPPRSCPVEPLSPLSRAQSPSLSQLFLFSSSSHISVSSSVRLHVEIYAKSHVELYTESHVESHIRSQPEALYVELDHAESLCFDEYGRSCTLAELYKYVRSPTSSRVSQSAELVTIELVLVKKFKLVHVLDLKKF